MQINKLFSIYLMSVFSLLSILDPDKQIVQSYFVSRVTKPVELIKKISIEEMKKCNQLIPSQVFSALTDGDLKNYEAKSFGLSSNQELVCKMKDLENITYRIRPLTDNDKNNLLTCLE